MRSIVLVLALALAAVPIAKAKSRLLFGHRGNSAELPENTLLAFESCVELGCEAIEIDVHLTADQQAVVFHDDTVDRTTNGTGRVESFTLAELKTLDAGYQFTLDGGRTFPFRGQGITVPTLFEVISEIQNLLINIDIKTHTTLAAQIIAEIITKTNEQERFIVGSFDAATFKAFKAAAPTVNTLASVAEISQFTLLFYANRSQEHVPQSSYYEVPTGYVRDVASYIAAANNIGVRMVFWTINEENEIRELVEAGADGIISDNVRIAAAVFKEYESS